jgi:hypothetical protein
LTVGYRRQTAILYNAANVKNKCVGRAVSNNSLYRHKIYQAAPTTFTSSGFHKKRVCSTVLELSGKTVYIRQMAWKIVLDFREFNSQIHVKQTKNMSNVYIPFQVEVHSFGHFEKLVLLKAHTFSSLLKSASF